MSATERRPQPGPGAPLTAEDRRPVDRTAGGTIIRTGHRQPDHPGHGSRSKRLHSRFGLPHPRRWFRRPGKRSVIDNRGLPEVVNTQPRRRDDFSVVDAAMASARRRRLDRSVGGRGGARRPGDPEGEDRGRAR